MTTSTLPEPFVWKELGTSGTFAFQIDGVGVLVQQGDGSVLHFIPDTKLALAVDGKYTLIASQKTSFDSCS